MLLRIWKLCEFSTRCKNLDKTVQTVGKENALNPNAIVPYFRIRHIKDFVGLYIRCAYVCHLINNEWNGMEFTWLSQECAKLFENEHTIRVIVPKMRISTKRIIQCKWIKLHRKTWFGCFDAMQKKRCILHGFLLSYIMEFAIMLDTFIVLKTRSINYGFIIISF